jgi:hypothetical protein
MWGFVSYPVLQERRGKVSRKLQHFQKTKEQSVWFNVGLITTLTASIAATALIDWFAAEAIEERDCQRCDFLLSGWERGKRFGK